MIYRKTLWKLWMPIIINVVYWKRWLGVALVLILVIITHLYKQTYVSYPVELIMSQAIWVMETSFHSDLPKHASPGHFVVTIVSLNHQMVLHTLFPLPDQISHNATMAGLLSGLVSEECTKAETYDPSPTNISNLLDTAKHCHDRRMLFVLDLFRYRGDAVEIVLNRAFVVRWCKTVKRFRYVTARPGLQWFWMTSAVLCCLTGHTGLHTW